MKDNIVCPLSKNILFHNSLSSLVPWKKYTIPSGSLPTTPRHIFPYCTPLVHAQCIFYVQGHRYNRLSGCTHTYVKSMYFTRAGNIIRRQGSIVYVPWWWVIFLYTHENSTIASVHTRATHSLSNHIKSDSTNTKMVCCCFKVLLRAVGNVWSLNLDGTDQ